MSHKIKEWNFITAELFILVGMWAESLGGGPPGGVEGAFVSCKDFVGTKKW